jgi:hypothetical protein
MRRDDTHGGERGRHQRRQLYTDGLSLILIVEELLEDVC